ncbi:hypothetical protein [Streptomyces marianii]|uniref:Uncharacterized protein n=1 Tax=Streptomyces marianii TaxID=1817406 RepID=A0A5R9ECU7_9ACTN|nr:hypothetical protein [Streptomyces marianii]TLQ45793.1 hypothetical protein FEF34_24855 [Streptomyces marianii]
MSIDLTRHVQPAFEQTAQRNGHIAALAAAEHIISSSPVIPADVTTRCRSWATNEPGIDLFFYDAPNDVRRFGAHFGLAVAERITTSGASEVKAEGTVHGVQVRAWCLTGSVSS